MTGITYSQAISRGVRLRCPRCGQGKLFRNLLLMHRQCDTCGFVYERAPGYFLGSAYLNYGFIVITLTLLYVGLHFGLGWSNRAVTPLLVAYFVIVPLLMFPHARSMWLAMDCFYDPVGASVSDPAQPDYIHEPEVR